MSIAGAQAFADFLVAPATQAVIGNFGKVKYGQQLFVPDAGKRIPTCARSPHFPALAVTAGFGRAISDVGASLMVGGNIVGQTRILTTAIALETGRGEFALAIALGMILLLLALAVNVALGVAPADNSPRL